MTQTIFPGLQIFDNQWSVLKIERIKAKGAVRVLPIYKHALG